MFRIILFWRVFEFKELVLTHLNISSRLGINKAILMTLAVNLLFIIEFLDYCYNTLFFIHFEGRDFYVYLRKSMIRYIGSRLLTSFIFFCISSLLQSAPAVISLTLSFSYCRSAFTCGRV